jgi:hypothetical protein
MKGLKNPNQLYKVKTLNHVSIYNAMFNLVNNYRICGPCCMMNNDGDIASERQQHLQQTPHLLCPKPYKHPKPTKLNLNITHLG